MPIACGAENPGPFTRHFFPDVALLDRGAPRPGDWVLIHGASGEVGLAACQFALAAGLKVIGSAGSVQGPDLVSQQGVPHGLRFRMLVAGDHGAANIFVHPLPRWPI